MRKHSPATPTPVPPPIRGRGPGPSRHVPHPLATTVSSFHVRPSVALCTGPRRPATATPISLSPRPSPLPQPHFPETGTPTHPQESPPPTPFPPARALVTATTHLRCSGRRKDPRLARRPRRFVSLPPPPKAPAFSAENFGSFWGAKTPVLASTSGSWAPVASSWRVAFDWVPVYRLLFACTCWWRW
jgi:hypothetical protein